MRVTCDQSLPQPVKINDNKKVWKFSLGRESLSSLLPPKCWGWKKTWRGRKKMAIGKKLSRATFEEKSRLIKDRLTKLRLPCTTRLKISRPGEGGINPTSLEKMSLGNYRRFPINMFCPNLEWVYPSGLLLTQMTPLPLLQTPMGGWVEALI